MEDYVRLLQEHKVGTAMHWLVSTVLLQVSHLVCATDKLYQTEELEKSG